MNAPGTHCKTHLFELYVKMMGDRLTVGQRTLTPPVLVRIQVPQPSDDPEPANGHFIQNVQTAQYRRPAAASRAAFASLKNTGSIQVKNCRVGSA